MSLTTERVAPPTPRRRQRARDDGDVAHSHDLAAALPIVGGLLAVWLLGGGVVRFFGQLATAQLGGGSWSLSETDTVVDGGRALLPPLAGAVLPLLGLGLLIGIVAHALQGGLQLRPARLLPDVNRISPLRGAARMFSASAAQRLAMALLKLAVVVGLAAAILTTRRSELVALAGLPRAELPGAAARLLLVAGGQIGLGLLLLAGLDYAWQRWLHERRLWMTAEQLREELKGIEGDPQLQARRRAVRQQLGGEQQLAAARRADVLLTSADGTAIALAVGNVIAGNVIVGNVARGSDPRQGPELLARGDGPQGVRLRALARRQGVPVVENSRLAIRLARAATAGGSLPAALRDEVRELLEYAAAVRDDNSSRQR